MVSASVQPLNSAGGVLALLDESEYKLKQYALEQLDQVVDQFWPEIADSVAKIEVLYEDDKCAFRELAALVASKVYYHLGEFDDSVTFALGAGKLFDIESLDKRTEFIETIIGKCIDKYISLKQAEGADKSVVVDPRLKTIVERMFSRCLDDKDYKQAIGIALESRRLDVVEAAITRGNAVELLKYTTNATMALEQNVAFRKEVLCFVVQMYEKMKEPDYLAISHCLVLLSDVESLAKILSSLVAGASEHHLLTAFQISFDVYESATQEYLQNVIALLPTDAAADAPPAVSDANAMETDEPIAVAATSPIGYYSKLRSILSGQETTKLHLEFLSRNNKADMLIMKNIKSSLEARSSVYHSAVTFAHAFMTAGTTSDQFLRDNMDWLSRASNWTKFTATAQLGVIHKGNIDNSMTLLDPYLPKNGVSSSVYSEGGSLFALGMIHANHGASALDYLKKQLTATHDEVVQHGACLGLGAAGIATGDCAIFDALKTVLYTDSAVAGEAAGYAMGLVMVGTGASEAFGEMLQYARETQHEKIIRGLAIGMALMLYAQEEKAEAPIQQLMGEQDSILRYGGVFAIALAYSGTSNNKAISQLLHTAVSDSSDDVRRAAVMALAFVLVRSPKQVPRIVQLLSESYNPHVRYGSAMALGIACAGTGMADALDLLEPMTKDPIDFVRQGAFMAAAMILIQQNEVSCPRVAAYRKRFSEIITEKHMEAMAKFGAVLASGILDAGGRNVTLSLLSRNGPLIRESVIGMTLFLQHWYWYPMTHFLSLAFTPTPLICLNKDLKVPKLELLSNAKPSLFAYPPPTKPPVEEKVEKVATAVLSTTAKAKLRAKKSEKEKGADVMETDDVATSPVTKSDASDAKEAEPMVEESAVPKKPEPDFELLPNMCRVVPAQLKFTAFKSGSRYVPVKKVALGGIILASDSRPTEATEFIEFSTKKVEEKPATSEATEQPEPAAPEPFELVE